MKKAWLFVLMFPGMAFADGQVSGYIQEHLSYRTESKSACGGVEGCPTMVNEQRVQLLGEWQASDTVNASLRVDAFHDAAIGQSDAVVREGFLDWVPSKSLSIRTGRQVITWGVADYLFVNDIFPKNYDAFFTGKPFDHMKEAVDAVKGNVLIGDTEWELVVARPQEDQLPLPSRFISASFPPGVVVNDASRDGTDIALKIAGKCGRWDSAIYAGRYHSREPGLYMGTSGLQWDMQPTRHIGASMIGSLANGVAMAEVAYVDTDLKSGNMNRYAFGKQVKALVGYSADLGQDTSFSAQYHHETEVDYDDYRNSLAPTVSATPRTRQTVYLKLSKRLYNQTLGLGVQLFAAFDGGNYVNPFASYSIVDGLNLETGANLFGGKADSRYGMLKHDSNVYASLRYSF